MLTVGFPSGMPVKVTTALPYVGRDEDGQRIGLVHWFVDRGIVWVSQQAYDELKNSWRAE